MIRFLHNGPAELFCLFSWMTVSNENIEIRIIAFVWDGYERSSLICQSHHPHHVMLAEWIQTQSHKHKLSFLSLLLPLSPSECNSVKSLPLFCTPKMFFPPISFPFFSVFLSLLCFTHHTCHHTDKRTPYALTPTCTYMDTHSSPKTFTLECKGTQRNK